MLFKGFSLERRLCFGGAGVDAEFDADAGEGVSGGTYGHTPCGVDAWSGTCDNGGDVFLRIGHDGGGSALPRGIACGATGAAGAVSAQNQPMTN